jgi:tRNA nucleotidyltransferase/poly(A) polymerase
MDAIKVEPWDWLKDIKLYEVGGCVRDKLLGKESKDIDFVVIAPSFEKMREYLLANRFKIFVEKPEFVTIRASVPNDHPLKKRTKDADFVLARKDAPTGDGRRPDYVEPGTLHDDLARRDFTVNAMAMDPFTNEIIDPHGGQQDLAGRILRFVGRPKDRIREDGLRVLRGLRFIITKNLFAHDETWAEMISDEASHRLYCVSTERVREEVEKMMAHDTVRSINLLAKLPPAMQYAIFRQEGETTKPLRLSATMKV